MHREKVEVVNNRLGAGDLTYVALLPGVPQYDSLEFLLRDHPQLMSRARLSKSALYHMLRVGATPLPYSVSEDIRILGPGDGLLRSPEGLVACYEPKFLRQSSRQDSLADPSQLLSRLVEAVQAKWVPGRRGVLMQSGGKDSTALALALQRAGLAEACVGVTFRGTESDVEHDVAAAVARKLGLRHEVLSPDVTSPETREQLLSVFREMPYPSADQALFAYALCGVKYFDPDVVVFDGTGSDTPFGFPGQRWLRTMGPLQHFGLPGKSLAALASRRRPWSKLFHNNRAEIFFSNYYLSDGELSRVFPRTHVQEDGFWKGQSVLYRSFDAIEFASMVKLRHTDVEQVMRKGRTVAAARGAAIAFPWADEALTDYVFNLPESARFDSKSGNGKILLKEMLSKFLEYDSDKVGKHVFRFDVLPFLRAHREWIRSEICACLWWEDGSKVPLLLDHLYHEIEKGLRAHNAILALFCAAAWYNHSRWIYDAPEGVSRCT